MPTLCTGKSVPATAADDDDTTQLTAPLGSDVACDAPAPSRAESLDSRREFRMARNSALLLRLGLMGDAVDPFPDGFVPADEVPPAASSSVQSGGKQPCPLPQSRPTRNIRRRTSMVVPPAPRKSVADETVSSSSSVPPFLLAAWPHRESQITALYSALAIWIGAARTAAEGTAPSPSPLFVTGPPGSGKTGAVRAVLEEACRPTLAGGAYVDCATCGSVRDVLDRACRALLRVRGTAAEETIEGIVAEEDDEDLPEGGEVDATDLAEEGEGELNVHRLRSGPRRRRRSGDRWPVKKRKARAAAGSHLRVGYAVKARQGGVISSYGTVLARISRTSAEESGDGAQAEREEGRKVEGEDASAFGQIWPLVIVLDNAERLVEMNPHALGQILMLPRVKGIQACFVIISTHSMLMQTRALTSTWSAHSYNPRTLQEVFWPINFYFDAYPDVSTLKTIMKHSRNRALVCSSAYATPTTPVPRRILDSCYTQMLDALLQAVVTSTKDMTEIVRLARLLWGNVMEVICDQSAQWTQREGPAGNDLEALQTALDTHTRGWIRRILSTCLFHPMETLSESNWIRPTLADGLPQIFKYILTAAYLCQNILPTDDKRIFTSQKTGQRRKPTKRPLSIRPIPLERLAVVFVALVHQTEEGEGAKEGDFHTGLSGLVRLGLVSAISKRNGTRRFLCRVCQEEVDSVALSVNLDPSHYLL